MKSQGKESLHLLYDVLDKIESLATMPEGSNISLREAFKLEVNFYLLYLASGDGKITANERDYINDLLDLDISTQEFVQLINEHNIYSTEFEDRSPITLQIVSAFDKKMKQLNAGVAPLAPALIDFLERIGREFINCDGNVHQQEVADHTLYISKLKSKFLTSVSASDEVGFIGKKKGQSSSPIAIPSKKSGSNSHRYGPSKYKVGVDMPVGEYKLICSDRRAYYCISSDANGQRIIQNDNFYCQAYIDVHYGQYVELCRCYALPVSEAPLFDNSSGVYGPGEYKVGIEIPAGEYRLTALANRGYYSLEVYGGNGSRDIITNDNFTNATYVEIKRGQILVLSNCKLVM